jgi:hypothetical protein
MIQKIEKTDIRTLYEPQLSQIFKDNVPHYNRFFSITHNINNTRTHSNNNSYVLTTKNINPDISLLQFYKNYKNKHPFLLESLILSHYLHLLTAIDSLDNLDIVHNNINVNSIMYDTSQGLPIITSFNKYYHFKDLQNKNNIKPLFDTFNLSHEQLIIKHILQHDNWQNTKFDLLSLQNIPKKIISNFSNKLGKTIVNDIIHNHYFDWNKNSLDQTFDLYYKLLESE